MSYVATYYRGIVCDGCGKGLSICKNGCWFNIKEYKDHFTCKDYGWRITPFDRHYCPDCLDKEKQVCIHCCKEIVNGWLEHEKCFERSKLQAEEFIKNQKNEVEK